AARERVERPGVSCLLRVQQTLRLLQCAVGSDADRLVEQERAVDHSFGLTESMRRESRSPRSTETSYSKRSSGVVYSLMRRASCERRNPAARLRPLAASSTCAGSSVV